MIRYTRIERERITVEKANDLEITPFFRILQQIFRIVIRVKVGQIYFCNIESIGFFRSGDWRKQGTRSNCYKEQEYSIIII